MNLGRETCDECGFDSERWRVRDAVTFFDALGFWWRHAAADVDAAALNRRPADGVWSALEYGVHSALVTAVIREGIARTIAEDGVVLPSVVAPDAESEPARLEPDAVLHDIEREGRALARLARDAPADAWSHVASSGELRIAADGALFHAVHDASHHQFDVARGLRAIGAATPAHSGRVVQVNASDGGVPKLPVARAAITARGLGGDRQQNRKHHGRPFQALSIWSQDVIDELAAAGHPIAAGSAGENITVRDIDWGSLRPGTLLRVGSALAELSYPAVPCQKQTRWFSDGDFTRIAFENNPQWVRWYAWVREPGDVESGDAVLVQS